VVERKACAPRFLSYGCAVGLETMTTQIEVHGRRIGLGRIRLVSIWAGLSRLWTMPGRPDAGRRSAMNLPANAS
jgi:hypothetical protein